MFFFLYNLCLHFIRQPFIFYLHFLRIRQGTLMLEDPKQSRFTTSIKQQLGFGAIFHDCFDFYEFFSSREKFSVIFFPKLDEEEMPAAQRFVTCWKKERKTKEENMRWFWSNTKSEKKLKRYCFLISSLLLTCYYFMKWGVSG